MREPKSAQTETLGALTTTKMTDEHPGPLAPRARHGPVEAVEGGDREARDGDADEHFTQSEANGKHQHQKAGTDAKDVRNRPPKTEIHA